MRLDSDLFSAQDRVLAAVSGGLDSVALLHLLAQLKQQLNFTLAVAHLNHQIRKDTAERDADFVETLAKQYGLPFHLGVKNVPRLAKQAGLSLEDAGRRARYDFFFKEAGANNYTVLALAHHLDDQTETILFRLLRGAAARGLSGMAAERLERGLRIIRPLLRVAKAEIQQYVKTQALAFQEDETNQDNFYTRNKLRNEVLPLLKEINPGYQDGLQRTAAILRDDDDYLEKAARQAYAEVALETGPARVRLDAIALRGYHRAVARRVVRLAIEELCGALNDVSLSYVENFLENGLSTLSLSAQGKLLVSK